MTLVAFSEEEQVAVGDEKLTLRLDFGVITQVEGNFQLPFPSIAAHVRSPGRQYRIVGYLLWAMLREHHQEVTLDEAAGLIFSTGPEVSAKVGFALDALLERVFPIAEDREPKNPPKRRGRSKSFGGSG